MEVTAHILVCDGCRAERGPELDRNALHRGAERDGWASSPKPRGGFEDHCPTCRAVLEAAR